MAFGLTVGATLVYWILTTTTTYTDTEDDKTLLCLVAKTASLVWTRWTRSTVHLCQLTVLPNANTQQVAHYIALLLAI